VCPAARDGEAMARRRVSELVAGMVLSEDVVTPGGRFLMPRGTTLDAGHLKSLLAWNVPEAAVDDAVSRLGQDAPADAGEVAATTEAAETVVRERLCRLDLDHEAGLMLWHLAVNREAERLAHRDPAPSPEADFRQPAPADRTLPPVTVEGMLHNEPQLVSPPEVYGRISRVLRDPKSTVEDAAEAIRHDQSLAAKLLRLVNSSFYSRTMRAVHGRFPAKVDSLSRAVLVVGGRQLSTLALGVSVLPLFQDIPQGWVNMRLFWEHSVGCAVAAQAISGATGRGNPEAAFVGGLMHDIGRIILFKQAPHHMAAAMRQALDDRQPLAVVERQILGFDHAALGGALLHKWEFPANLETMVCEHHALRDGAERDAAAVIHLADIVANAMAWGGSGSRYAPPLDLGAWDRLGLAAGALSALLPGMEASLGETMIGFFPEDGGRT